MCISDDWFYHQFIHFEPTNTLSKIHPKNYNNSPPISKSWIRARPHTYTLNTLFQERADVTDILCCVDRHVENLAS